MMNIRTVLFVRAAILIIIGVGVLVSSLYNGSNEPETNQEKTVMKIILLATSMVITGIAISNIVFIASSLADSINPHVLIIIISASLASLTIV